MQLVPGQLKWFWCLTFGGIILEYLNCFMSPVKIRIVAEQYSHCWVRTSTDKRFRSVTYKQPTVHTTRSQWLLTFTLASECRNCYNCNWVATRGEARLLYMGACAPIIFLYNLYFVKENIENLLDQVSLCWLLVYI